MTNATRTAHVRLLIAVVPVAGLLAGCAVAKPNAAVSASSASASPTPTVEVTPTLTFTPIAPVTPSSAAPTTPSATPSAASTSAGAGTTGQGITQAIADQLQPGFIAYYAAVDGVLQAGGVGAPTQAMKDTMAGSVLDTWTKMATDYAAKGYKQKGSIKVESFSVGTVDKAKGTAMVDFCANASGVTVVDAAGATHAPADPTKRAVGATANLVYSSGHWRVTSLSGVTPIPACP